MAETAHTFLRRDDARATTTRNRGEVLQVVRHDVICVADNRTVIERIVFGSGENAPKPRTAISSPAWRSRLISVPTTCRGTPSRRRTVRYSLGMSRLKSQTKALGSSLQVRTSRSSGVRGAGGCCRNARAARTTTMVSMTTRRSGVRVDLTIASASRAVDGKRGFPARFAHRLLPEARARLRRETC